MSFKQMDVNEHYTTAVFAILYNDRYLYYQIAPENTEPTSKETSYSSGFCENVPFNTKTNTRWDIPSYLLFRDYSKRFSKLPNIIFLAVLRPAPFLQWLLPSPSLFNWGFWTVFLSVPLLAVLKTSIIRLYIVKLWSVCCSYDNNR